MYEDVVTVFNRRAEDGKTWWYPTVIEGVHVTQELGAGEAGYGRKRQDRTAVLVPYARIDGAPIVAGKMFLPPKLWQRADSPEMYVTFSEGEDFDFFIAEDWMSTDPVEDSAWPGGFYDAMVRSRDDVFAITAVCRYNALPHFEITGR